MPRLPLLFWTGLLTNVWNCYQLYPLIGSCGFCYCVTTIIIIIIIIISFNSDNMSLVVSTWQPPEQNNNREVETLSISPNSLVRRNKWSYQINIFTFHGKREIATVRSVLLLIQSCRGNERKESDWNLPLMREMQTAVLSPMWTFLRPKLRVIHSWGFLSIAFCLDFFFLLHHLSNWRFEILISR